MKSTYQPVGLQGDTILATIISFVLVQMMHNAHY